jgi:hypothetical protein
MEANLCGEAAEQAHRMGIDPQQHGQQAVRPAIDITSSSLL